MKENIEEERVVLVNRNDEAIGTMGKQEAHETGALHRAFSIFLFDDQGRLLLQRRADDKYHSAGLWTNTCCSHPRQHESLEQAANRRLKEEMGIDVPLEHRFSFIYRAVLDGGMQEHEFDHVFFGAFNGVPVPEPKEVAEWKFIAITELDAELKQHPDRFTFWLKDCWPRIKAELGDR